MSLSLGLSRQLVTMVIDVETSLRVAIATSGSSFPTVISVPDRSRANVAKDTGRQISRSKSGLEESVSLARARAIKKKTHLTCITISEFQIVVVDPHGKRCKYLDARLRIQMKCVYGDTSGREIQSMKIKERERDSDTIHMNNY